MFGAPGFPDQAALLIFYGVTSGALHLRPSPYVPPRANRSRREHDRVGFFLSVPDVRGSSSEPGSPSTTRPSPSARCGPSSCWPGSSPCSNGRPRRGRGGLRSSGVRGVHPAADSRLRADHGRPCDVHRPPPWTAAPRARRGPLGGFRRGGALSRQQLRPLRLAFDAGYANIVSGPVVNRLTRWGVISPACLSRRRRKSCSRCSSCSGPSSPPLIAHDSGLRCRASIAPSRGRRTLARILLTDVRPPDLRRVDRSAADHRWPSSTSARGDATATSATEVDDDRRRLGAPAVDCPLRVLREGRQPRDAVPHRSLSGVRGHAALRGDDRVDRVRKRAPGQVPTAQLAIAGSAALYLALSDGHGWTHQLSHPIDRKAMERADRGPRRALGEPADPAAATSSAATRAAPSPSTPTSQTGRPTAAFTPG